MPRIVLLTRLNSSLERELFDTPDAQESFTPEGWTTTLPPPQTRDVFCENWVIDHQMNHCNPLYRDRGTAYNSRRVSEQRFQAAQSIQAFDRSSTTSGYPTSIAEADTISKTSYS